MKRLFASLLVLVMLLCLAAGCSKTDPQETTSSTGSSEASAAPSESAEASQPTEEADYINYKGLHSGTDTQLDMQEAEGRPADFSFENNGTTIYAYNDVTLDNLTFTQVQYTFGDVNRISCTITTDDPETAMADCLAAMSARYGDAAEGGGIYSWHDHTSNYVMLTQLNETTVQLAFYFSETAQ